MSEKAEDVLLLSKEGTVAIITLNRPSKFNAISKAMMTGFPRVIEELRRDDEVKAVIVTGAGDAFCAGDDLEEAAQGIVPMDDRRGGLTGRLGWETALAFREFEKPMIAAINGVAVGGGASIALACDIRLASDKARIGMVWINIGLLPDCGASYFLPRLIGVSKACDLMFTGRLVTSAEAAAMGLVDRVVPHDQLMTEARELAKLIAAKSPVAMELTKRAIYNGIAQDLPSQLDFETQAQRICLSTEYFQEALRSFFEKRKTKN